MTVKKSRKFLSFFIYSSLKKVHLQQLKGMQSFQLLFDRGCYLLMKVTRKGTFSTKKAI